MPPVSSLSATANPVAASMRSARSVRLSAGCRQLSFVGHLIDSRCAARQLRVDRPRDQSACLSLIAKARPDAMRPERASVRCRAHCRASVSWRADLCACFTCRRYCVCMLSPSFQMISYHRTRSTLRLGSQSRASYARLSSELRLYAIRSAIATRDRYSRATH